MHSELKRAHSLIMKVEADSEDALVHELEHVIFRIRTNQITCGTMGGSGRADDGRSLRGGTSSRDNNPILLN